MSLTISHHFPALVRLPSSLSSQTQGWEACTFGACRHQCVESYALVYLYHCYSIGKGGSKIKEIQEASGARINASEAMLPGSTEVGDHYLVAREF